MAIAKATAKATAATAASFRNRCVRATRASSSRASSRASSCTASRATPRGGAPRGEASRGDAPRGAGCDYGGEEEVRGSVRGVTPPTDSYVFLSSSSSSCVSVAAVGPPLSHRDVRDGQRETLGAG